MNRLARRAVPPTPGRYPDSAVVIGPVGPTGNGAESVANPPVGHSSPEHTLRRYVHLLPQEEVDLSFAEISVPKRPYTAPLADSDFSDRSNYLIPMARREGFDGSLRSAKSNPWGLEGRFGSEGSAALAFL